MPKRTETTKQAICKLEKAIAYKTEALDSSIESIFLEMVSIQEKLDEDKTKLANTLEKFYGLTELSGSIKEMHKRKISYENIKSLDGSKVKVPEVKVDGVPDDFDGDMICEYSFTKDKCKSKSEVDYRIDDLENRLNECVELVSLISNSIIDIENRMSCVEHDVVNHLKSKKCKFLKKRKNDDIHTIIHNSTTKESGCLSEPVEGPVRSDEIKARS